MSDSDPLAGDAKTKSGKDGSKRGVAAAPTTPRGIPLNIPGAYALPPLSQDFPIDDAHVPLPPPYDESMRDALRRIPPNSKWILPHVTAQKGKRHSKRVTGNRTTYGAANSNWAGGGVLNGVQVPKPALGSRIAAYIMPSLNQEHVVFIGTDQQVYELVYLNSEWIWTSLTAVTGAPSADPSFGLAAYTTSYDGHQHVVYVDKNGRIQELWYDTAWHVNDLFTAAKVDTKNLAVAPGSALVGYETPGNNEHHVVFIGTRSTGRSVQQLVFAGNWVPHDFTDFAKAPAPVANNILAAYVTTSNSQQHIVYLFSDRPKNILNHLMELSFDAGDWHPTDLHARAPDAASFPADPASNIAGYQTPWNQQQHVVFVGIDGNIHEFAFAGSWNIQHLTVTGGTLPGPAPGASLDGYATNWNQQQHVNFVATDNTVQELFFDGSWHQSDLLNRSGLSGSVKALSSIPIAGYATEYDSQQHVIFIGDDNDVEELWFDSQWHPNDLTQQAVTATRVAPLTAASATWTVPAVSHPDEPESAKGGYQSGSWVGIDGWRSHDLLQAGVAHNVDGDGNPSYYAWYEWFDNDSNVIDNVPVRPGDDVFVQVSYNSDFAGGSVHFQNETTGAHFQISVDPPPGAIVRGDSAEWIMEAPNGGEPTTSIPQFTPVVFKHAKASGPTVGVLSPKLTREILRDGTALTSTALSATPIDGNLVTINYLLWHASNLMALSSGATNTTNAGRVSSLCGYPTTYNNQHHVIYIGTDSDVHELSYDNGWHHANLTQNSGCPVNIIGGASVTGYATEFNRQHHVISVGSDGNLWELWFDSSWHPNNLITAVVDEPAPPQPLTNSPVVGYATGWNQQHHVIYIGPSNRLHELFFDGSWHHTDLTDKTGITWAGGSALSAFATGFDNQQHIYCLDPSMRLRELTFDGAWHTDPVDPVQSAGAPAPDKLTTLAGTNSEFDQQRRVYYVDNLNHIWQLSFPIGGPWNKTDISAQADATDTQFLPAANATLAAYATEYDQLIHVVYIGADSLIHELFFDGGWHHVILSQLSGAPSPRANTPLIGYGTDYSRLQHVLYIDANNNVEELWF